MGTLALPAWLMTHLTTRRMCHTQSFQLRRCEWLIRAFVFVFDSHPKAFVKWVKNPQNTFASRCFVVFFRTVSVDQYLYSVQKEMFSIEHTHSQQLERNHLIDALMQEKVLQVEMSSLAIWVKYNCCPYGPASMIG